MTYAVNKGGGGSFIPEGAVLYRYIIAPPPPPPAALYRYNTAPRQESGETALYRYTGAAIDQN